MVGYQRLSSDLNVTKDVDYYQLSYVKRSINLDEVKLSKDQVLTGVRFCVINGRLTIEARGTVFDYLTGKLKGREESVWISNAKGYNEIRLVHLNQPDQFSSYLVEEVVKVADAYIKFGPTGYLQDVGQRTIPLIDTKAVEPRYLVPIAGLGLHYKRIEYYAGYIAPKLIVYDFEPHILA